MYLYRTAYAVRRLKWDLKNRTPGDGGGGFTPAISRGQGPEHAIASQDGQFYRQTDTVSFSKGGLLW